MTSSTPVVALIAVGSLSDLSSCLTFLLLLSVFLSLLSFLFLTAGLQSFTAGLFLLLSYLWPGVRGLNSDAIRTPSHSLRWRATLSVQPSVEASVFVGGASGERIAWPAFLRACWHLWSVTSCDVASSEHAVSIFGYRFPVGVRPVVIRRV
jgi:hypothetical protein